MSEQILRQVPIFDDIHVTVSIEESRLKEMVERYITEDFGGRSDNFTLETLNDAIYSNLTTDDDVVGSEMAYGDEECDMPLTLESSAIIADTIKDMVGKKLLIDLGSDTYMWGGDTLDEDMHIWQDYNEYLITESELTAITIDIIQSQYRSTGTFTYQNIEDQVVERLNLEHDTEISNDVTDDVVETIRDAIGNCVEDGVIEADKEDGKEDTYILL